jgi:N-acetylmuramate 1-kinase
LSSVLQKNNQTGEILQLTPDASTREFFRVFWNDTTAIACVYPEKIDKHLPQIDVTRLFLAANLPVAEIYDFDEDSGIVIHEDFGDVILRDVLLGSDKKIKNDLLDKSIDLIAKIQAATEKAFELDSIASRLRFDEEKLLWELKFFKTHYFESLKKRPLSAIDDENLIKEFTELSRELESYAKYLCHRDFHAANLMIDDKNNLRIIDHQDARIGSAAYDLVSLLLDRVTVIPSEHWLDEKKNYFLNSRKNISLGAISSQDFDYEFDLSTIQRCLKANGTFANQTANFGKTNYIQFIKPMFQIVLQTCRKLDRFPVLQKIIENELFKKYKLSN